MSELEDLIRNALRDDDQTAAPDETPATRLVDLFMRHSRWVAGFAWMKMGGTLLICTFAAVSFFAAESSRAQLASATIFTAGFVGFAMWWIWYWMVLNRNACSSRYRNRW